MRKGTYNPPKAKTAMRATFWLVGSMSRFRPGIGNIKINMSVKMLRDEAVTEISQKPAHFSGSKNTGPFQNVDIGRQMKRCEKNVTLAKINTDSSAAYIALRIFFV